MSFSSPVRSLPSRSARRPAGVEPVSSATGTSEPGMSACSVAKCCSASVSVGAMRAACMSCSTARSMACRATTVLPEPTSPMSRRSIGRSAARSASISSIAAAWSPVGVKGSSVSRQTRESVGSSASGIAACVARRSARRRSCTTWSTSSSSKASRARPPSRSPKCAAAIAAGRSGRRSATRSDAGSGSTTSATAPRCSRTAARICVEVMPLVAGYCEAASATLATASVRAWLLTRKRLAPWYLPASMSRVPALYWSLSHGWLKKVAFMTPVASLTTASTSGFMPRRRTGRELIERTSTMTVATSSGVSSAIVRASPESRGMWSSRAPTVVRPSASAASAAGRGFQVTGSSRREGRGQRTGAALSAAASSSSALAKAVGILRP